MKLGEAPAMEATKRQGFKPRERPSGPVLRRAGKWNPRPQPQGSWRAAIWMDGGIQAVQLDISVPIQARARPSAASRVPRRQNSEV